MKYFIQILITIITYSQFSIAFANWTVDLTAQDSNNIGGNHVIKFGNCDTCTDDWKYGEDEYDYPNPQTEYTNIHFFNLDWFGQIDDNGNSCSETEFSTDFRSKQPSSNLQIWNIKGSTGNDLNPNIPIDISWEADSINNISNDYDIYIYVDNTGFNMRQSNSITIDQQDLQLNIENNNYNTNIKILVGACAATGSTTYYNDQDGDGWGSNEESEFCAGYEPDGWVNNNADLDDEIFCISNNFDCNGILCGSSIIDDCGICNGENKDMDCSGECFGSSLYATLCSDSDSDESGTPNSQSDVCIELPETNNIFLDSDNKVLFHTNEPIYGFQFNVSGSYILNAYGGEAENAGFMISYNDSSLIAFSTTSSPINIDKGVLIELELNNQANELSELVVSNGYGIEIEFEIEELQMEEYTVDCNDPFPNCYENYYDCTNTCGGNAVEDQCGICEGSGPVEGYTCNGVPELFVHNSSSMQAFYFFNSATIDEISINDNDWIAAFNNEICVGSRRWGDCNGTTCELPILGDDGTEYTEGYMNNGELPTFIIFKSSDNTYHNAIPSEEIPWQNMDINSINTLSATYQTDYCLQLHSGANLKSFYAIPESNTIPDVMAELGQDVIGLITEGGACTQLIPGFWVGSQCSIDIEKGYWILMHTNAELCIEDAILPDSEIIYNLHLGSNLISFPSSENVLVKDALPSEMQSSISGIITEGGACSQIFNGFWAGSQCNLSGGKGYWFIANNDIDFSFNLDNLNRSTPIQPGPNYPAGYKINQSSHQAFYFIDKVIINNELIDDGWIFAYKENVLIGLRKWDGELTDIPVMGNDGYNYSREYINKSEIPQFAHFNQYTGEIIIFDTKNTPEWENNTLYMLGTLESNNIIPNKIELNVFPNPFNPITTLQFTLETESDVTISIYNIYGQEIEQFVNEFKSAGSYEYLWNASRYPSGVYLARLITNQSNYTQKLILMK